MSDPQDTKITGYKDTIVEGERMKWSLGHLDNGTLERQDPEPRDIRILKQMDHGKGDGKQVVMLFGYSDIRTSKPSPASH